MRNLLPLQTELQRGALTKDGRGKRKLKLLLGAAATSSLGRRMDTRMRVRLPRGSEETGKPLFTFV